MRRITTIVLGAALALSTIAAGQAADPPEGIDHMIEVGLDDTGQVKAAGGTGGVNPVEDATCASSSYNATCEKTLVLVTDGGTAVADVTPAYPSDYDVEVFASDETGAAGDSLGLSANPYSPLTPNEVVEWEAGKGEYYLVIVYYRVGGGGYSMTVGVD